MSAVLCTLWTAVLAQSHPDPEVAQCLLAYRLTAAAYSRVSAAVRSSGYDLDGQESDRSEWDELSDGTRQVVHHFGMDRARGRWDASGDGIAAVGHAYSFHLVRNGSGWKADSINGVQSDWLFVHGRRPFDAGRQFERPLVALTARPVTWRGESVVELRYDYPDPPVGADETRVIGGVFLQPGHPGLVRGRRFYHGGEPDRWVQEEVYEYRPNDGPWPRLVGYESWKPGWEGRTSRDMRTVFSRYERLDRPPDPARFTLSAFGLPEPTALPYIRPEFEPASFAGAKPPAEPPPPDDRWQWWAIAGIVVVGAGMFAWVGRRPG